jgi:hypothetical protein
LNIGNTLYRLLTKKKARSKSGHKSEAVEPLNFLIKYDPPKIGVKYEDSHRPGKFKVKKVTLAHLKKEGNDADRVVNDLFRCYPVYFNRKYTSKTQVKELITKIIGFHETRRLEEQTVTK